ncbi:hypothetical protein GCM10022270_31290 [Terriglobus aquaticus]
MGLAIVFTVLLVSLIGYARYRALRARLNLPKQLGIDIKSEANGFTISRSGKDGRPLFTIHGSKAIQHQNGITTLRDVAVTLYGPAGSNRTDSIRGGEFEYDQKNGVLRAMGETLLDVGIAEGSNAPANAKRLTMQGKGLVFLQKLGLASTKEQIRFQYGASQGEAVGADYDMDTGVVTLQHDVHLHSAENRQTQRIDAAAAQLNRNTRVATLQDATVTQGADSMQAPHMVATLRSAPDEHAGTLQKVDASGGVVLHTASGERVQAPELHADVTDQNRLELVTMQGGVRLQDEQNQGSAEKAVLRFRNGVADHLSLAGHAYLQQNEAADRTRTLEGNTIDSTLLSTAGAHVSLGEMHAVGSGRLLVRQPGKHPEEVETTELTSPELVSHAVPGARGSQVHDVEASRGAHLVQDDGAGAVRTTSSDELTATFRPAGKDAGSAELDSLVQRGHVVLHETQPARAAQKGEPAQEASTTDATGAQAEYHASTDVLVLTGSPRVSGNGVQLAAERVTIHRETGDAEATGSVRGSVAATFPSGGNRTTREGGTTQLVGESVRLTHSTGVVLLQGGGTDARLWSSNGQVEAPTIEADRKSNTLHAFGPGAISGAAPVRTVLLPASASAASRGPAAAGNANAASKIPTRVFSRDLLYRGGAAGKPGTAEFRGGVRVLQGEDVITAETATAILQPAAATAATSAPGMLAGGVQSMTAEDHVRVQQGARVATGSHLLYTASTRDAVLTGSPGALPVVRDPMQGILTGTQLLLHMGQGRGDNQVEVSGAPNTPVHTELDVPEKGNGPGSTARSPGGRKSRPTP